MSWIQIPDEAVFHFKLMSLEKIWILLFSSYELIIGETWPFSFSTATSLGEGKLISKPKECCSEIHEHTVAPFFCYQLIQKCRKSLHHNKWITCVDHLLSLGSVNGHQIWWRKRTRARTPPQGMLNVMVIITGNEISNQSPNLERGCLCFTLY